MPNVAVNFGDALVALKEGKRVARAGWNDKDMWLVLARPHSVVGGFTGDMILLSSFVPWFASQTDLLAEDWEIVE